MDAEGRRPRFVKGNNLGDFAFPKGEFPGLSSLFSSLQTPAFSSLNEQEKSSYLSSSLCELIQNEKAPSFALPSVIDFIDKVVEKKIVEHYNFSQFELWLNQYAGLTTEQNLAVRGKIVGKLIPRDEYQLFFPVGMGRTYPGSHFVTAHGSPDLDTTIASFWGWIDAFGARVGEGLHIWNVPGGIPISQVEVPILFQLPFGASIFDHLPQLRTTLAISGLDLLSQSKVIRKQTDELAFNIEHERHQNAVILIDKKGYYLGDWRSFDIEGVHQVIMLLNACLRWYENNLHIELISLFGKEEVVRADLPKFLRTALGTRIRDCAPAKDFTEKQESLIEGYLTKVLGVQNGLSSTFEEFAIAMEGLSIFEFQEFLHQIGELKKSTLFDTEGKLIEDRPAIFHYLEAVIKGLDTAIQSIRIYVERLDVALNIKTQVFGYLPQYVSYRADFEEIRGKMGSYPYLTVTYTDKKGKLLPLGVIRSSQIFNGPLGTVSLRDFCNREETKIPSYLEVISVIDHHKSSLTTASPPVALISDAQSSNALIADLSFAINDRYSTGGMSLAEIDAQISEVSQQLENPESRRLLQRLLQKKSNALKEGTFISPYREFLESLHFLYAILDDTDLLTKVSVRDLRSVASLLNRLKSLSLGKEVEIVTLEDLSPHSDFIAAASKRILQNSDMYSLYRKIYLSKEKAVEESMLLCIKGEVSSVFSDTKALGGCSRVGQTKMFAKNTPTFTEHAREIQKIWLSMSERFYQESKEIDLYLHMVSTIAGAEDVYSDSVGAYPHKDQMWIWIPMTPASIAHLKSFLNAMRRSPQMQNNELELEFLGENWAEYDQIFTESFLPVTRRERKTSSLPIAVLHYKAGTLNSRKAMIAPCLPKLVG